MLGSRHMTHAAQDLQPLLTDDAPVRALQRRLYLRTLTVLCPTTLILALFVPAYPEPLRGALLLCALASAVLLVVLWRGWAALRTVAWSLLLIGVLINETLLIGSLVGTPYTPHLYFYVTLLTFAWSFLSFGDRLGRRLALGIYLLTLGTALLFVPPGTPLAQTDLAPFWRMFTIFSVISPIFIVVLSALATLTRDQMQGRLRALSQFVYQDALTGLPNRRAFQEELDRRVRRAVDSGAHGTLMLININEFVHLNDRLGHAAGDEALRILTARWQDGLVAGSHLSRTDGDEFALILPTLAPTELAGQIDRVLSRTHEPMELGGEVHTLQARVGVSHFPQHGDDASTVTSHAGLALAAARGQEPPVATYSAELAAATERRRQVLHTLEVALAHQGLHLVYQPIFDLHTGEVRSAEALVRCRFALTPEPGPDEFIAVAEAAERMRPVGQWIMGAVLGQLRAWHDSGVHLPRVNVNVSAQELLTPGYAEALLAQLSSRGLDPQVLELELTERSVLEDAAVRELHLLRQAGMAVSIDDFGTGHSSLAWLHALPITCVKLDRRFTRMLGQDGAADRLAHTVVTLARALELEVVAEGIETQEQLRRLRELGCVLGQGYLFTKPLSPSEFVAFWRQASRTDVGQDTSP